MSFLETNTTESYDGWILDSGATDHMTYDASDFSARSSPRRTSIANANGDISLVKWAGTVMISLALSLTNILFVPSLSHKLLSLSQVTKELNCIVLIYPTFCLLHDILTKEIIGRGTKKGGGSTIWKILASVELTIREALVIEIRRTFCCDIVG